MELYSLKFQDAVVKALNSEKMVVGVIQKKPNPFTDKIKKRKDVETIEVTMENRDKLPETLFSYLSK